MGQQQLSSLSYPTQAELSKLGQQKPTFQADTALAQLFAGSGFGMNGGGGAAGAQTGGGTGWHGSAAGGAGTAPAFGGSAYGDAADPLKFQPAERSFASNSYPRNEGAGGFDSARANPTERDFIMAQHLAALTGGAPGTQDYLNLQRSQHRGEAPGPPDIRGVAISDHARLLDHMSPPVSPAQQAIHTRSIGRSASPQPHT